MNFLLTTLAARQCLTFNPPSDDQFDSALLSAPVLLQCLSREQDRQIGRGQIERTNFIRPVDD